MKNDEEDQAIITISLSGRRCCDLWQAEQTWRRRISEPGWVRPQGWCWHHNDDGQTVALIPTEVHASVAHTGGFAMFPVSSPTELRVGNKVPVRLTGNSRERCDPDFLTALEEALGTALPSDYRSFLQKYNGGISACATFVDLEGRAGNIVNAFLGFHPDHPNDLVHNLEMYGERLPGGMIPIANDPFGNLLCLSVVGDAQGHVWFWDHESEPIDEGEALGELALIAKSFADFLDAFHEVTP